ncbi:MAG TPA: heparan-alpha-glucosaminide N-acetyltransferase domain-containing protein [Chryseolinea sp.]|nr:heparan-alpha-glucosaminide N-acetyltransferase domain-containing protein [Chryseolinea sp.]
MITSSSPTNRVAPQSQLDTAFAGVRIQSVDVLRGLVMIIMAIDHVRVYAGIPAGGLTVGIFFTRWITHFCAPSFAFFAGTSAFLYYHKTGDRKALINFLVTRGLLLAVFELTIVRFFWTFNFDYAAFTITGVLWMLGWCMVLLAAFVRIKPITLAAIGVTMVLLQSLFARLPLLFPENLQEGVARYWGFFYPAVVAGKEGVVIGAGSGGLPEAFGISIFYVILPWLGVMMAGFGFGALLLKDAALVRKLCLWIGLGITLAFLIGATVKALYFYAPDDTTPFFVRVLGQQKYPPSQFYVMMTLGPIIALVPWAQRATGWLVDAVKMIGRVPMFYYLLHILLIHLSAFVVNLVLYGNIHQDWYVTAPFVGIEEANRWTLPILYIVWAIDVVVLYFVCAKYARYKADHPEIGWMKYV